MDAGPVTVPGPSGHAVSQWLLPLRHLRTGDTLLTFTNAVSPSSPLTRLALVLVFRDYW